VAVGLRSGVVEVWDIERGTHLALPPVITTPEGQLRIAAPTTAITPKGPVVSAHRQWRDKHTAKSGAGVRGPLRGLHVIGSLDARRIVTATEQGVIQIRPLIKAEEVDEEEDDAAAAGVRTWAAGSNLCCLR
jgi:hypothetical protein